MAWASQASAYAWMIKHGYGGCATCHADPSGGELLTRYGRAQSDLVLRMRYGRDDVSAQASESDSDAAADDFDSFDSFDAEPMGEPEPAAAEPAAAEPAPEPAAREPAGPSPTSGFLWGLVDLPEALLLGGAYRHLVIYEPTEGDVTTFPMQADLYGQIRIGVVRAAASVGAAKVPAGSPHARKAQVTTGQGDTLQLISRSHWIGVDPSRELSIRAGRLNLPFGVRIPEHVMWVRDATLTDRESDQQHGAAVAYTGRRWRGEVMVIAGNYQLSPDDFRERGYSGFAELLVFDRTGVGISSLVTRANADLRTLEPDTTWRHAHGGFGRVTASDALVVLVEANALLGSRHDPGYVGMLQADYELVQGLHLMGTAEVLDAGFSSSGGLERAAGFGEPRFAGWLSVDWFFLPQLEARVDAVARQNDPFALFTQLHVSL